MLKKLISFKRPFYLLDPDTHLDPHESLRGSKIRVHATVFDPHHFFKFISYTNLPPVARWTGSPLSYISPSGWDQAPAARAPACETADSERTPHAAGCASDFSPSAAPPSDSRAAVRMFWRPGSPSCRSWGAPCSRRRRCPRWGRSWCSYSWDSSQKTSKSNTFKPCFYKKEKRNEI